MGYELEGNQGPIKKKRSIKGNATIRRGTTQRKVIFLIRIGKMESSTIDKCGCPIPSLRFTNPIQSGKHSISNNVSPEKGDTSYWGGGGKGGNS